MFATATSTRFLALALLCAAGLNALVAPNPASLLKDKRVLVIDGTHGSHADARNAMTAKLNQIKTVVGFNMTQVATPPTSLSAYDIIVFNFWFDNQNPSFAAFQNAFKTWIHSGNKGWVGYHTSGANELNEWNWLRDSVTSMRYIVHSTAAQNGTVGKTRDAAILAQPIMAALPDSFRGQDEWYEFGTDAPTWPDVKVMYNLNEQSLASPLQHPMNPHPMAWYRQDARGARFFYTAMIHTASGVNSTSGNDFFPSLVLRGLEYVAGYTSTPIRLNGRGLYPGARTFPLRGGALQVDSESPYRLEILSLNGEVLHAASGRGGESHAPPVLSRPGLYLVKVSLPSGFHSQRVLVE